jgi:hypothetical protein
MTSFGEMVYKDVRSLERRLYWIVQVALDPVTSVLIRDREEETQNQRRSPVMTEAKIRVTHPQPILTRQVWDRFSREPWERARP